MIGEESDNRAVILSGSGGTFVETISRRAFESTP